MIVSVLVNFMVSRISGASAVLFVSQVSEVRAYGARYEQELNDHSSGGKRVRVAGSVQSLSAVIVPLRRSNWRCYSSSDQPDVQIEKCSIESPERIGHKTPSTSSVE